MKYYVTYKIDARYITEVEAESLKEAKEKAENNFMDADFGVAKDIDGEAIIVEDENGNYVWERQNRNFNRQKERKNKMERVEQTFLGKVLFTYEGWDEIDVAFLQFYNVQFPFKSMEEYNGMTVTLQLDGTMEIYDKNTNLVCRGVAMSD